MSKFKKAVQILLALFLIIILFGPYVTTAIQFFDGTRCDGSCADVAESIGKILGIAVIFGVLSLTVNFLNRHKHRTVVRNIFSITEKMVSVSKSRTFIIFLLCCIGIQAVFLVITIHQDSKRRELPYKKSTIRFLEEEPSASKQENNAINLLAAIQAQDTEPFLGKWEDGLATVRISEEGGGFYKIQGDVLEDTNSEFGPNMGGFDFTVSKASLLQSKIGLSDPDGLCKVEIIPQTTTLKITDNNQCGGMNARFAHELHKIISNNAVPVVEHDLEFYEKDQKYGADYFSALRKKHPNLADFLNDPDNAKKEVQKTGWVDALTAILVFGLVGGIARGIILVVQGVKKNPPRLKPLEGAETQLEPLKRLSVVLQGVWLFFALLIVGGRVFEGLRDTDTFEKVLFLLCLSAPVVFLHVGNWILKRGHWPLWVVIFTATCQFAAVMPVSDYFYDDDVPIWICAGMFVSFTIFYAMQNPALVLNRAARIVNKVGGIAAENTERGDTQK